MENSRLEKLLAFHEQNPADTFVTYAIATEWVSAGNDAEALKYYLKLEQETPDYVATYYHLAKLYERKGERELAITTYKTGMEKARRQNDNHSFAELQNACNNLELGLEDY